MLNDTIAAISSGLTESGIGIIRMSGPDSFKIIDGVFRNSRGGHVIFDEPNKVHHGFIINYVSRETLDEVLVINLKSPHSYTGEDTIEIDCHGGILMMKRILQNIIDAGARPAEPGEFTKRAFLNGRLDLAQAEAVIDIINAKNDKAIKASVMQLKGNISEEILKIRAEMLEDCAFIESALDDPEHYTLEGFSDKLKLHVSVWLKVLNKLINTYDRGRLIKEGIDTVIIGKPNAGKSSLLNALLGEERAIVTEIPGTTRDTITESVIVKGISLNIKDTAGIRKTDDVVESIGVSRAIKNAETADLILCVLDTSMDLDENDLGILKRINGYNASKVIVLNKNDLSQRFGIEEINKYINEPKTQYVYISAKEGMGIDELYTCISEMFESGDIGSNDEIVISSIRHYNLLNEAVASIMELSKSMDKLMPEDFFTIDIMDSYKYLGEILGEDVGEDLINEIFDRFCMGK